MVLALSRVYVAFQIYFSLRGHSPTLTVPERRCALLPASLPVALLVLTSLLLTVCLREEFIK